MGCRAGSTSRQQRWAVRLRLGQHGKRPVIENVLAWKQDCSHHSSQTCALLTASWRDFPSACWRPLRMFILPPEILRCSAPLQQTPGSWNPKNCAQTMGPRIQQLGGKASNHKDASKWWVLTNCSSVVQDLADAGSTGTQISFAPHFTEIFDAKVRVCRRYHFWAKKQHSRSSRFKQQKKQKYICI